MTCNMLQCDEHGKVSTSEGVLCRACAADLARERLAEKCEDRP